MGRYCFATSNVEGFEVKIMPKEFITKAHYPTDDIAALLELHKSNYGLCQECSSLSRLVPYPCPALEGIDNV